MKKAIMNAVCVYVTTRCNLKCKRCLVHIPYISEQKDVELERIQATFDELFELAERIEKVTISGGETFLYSKLFDLVCWLRKNYFSRIGRIEMFTNGTILPTKEFVEELKKWGKDKEKIFVDNYGEKISVRAKEITKRFDEYDINYELRNYNAQEAHCGGWVDFGDLRFEKKDKDGSVIKNGGAYGCVYLKGYRCMGIASGKLYPCTQVRMQEEFCLNSEAGNESLDLFDKTITNEEKISWLQKMEKVPYYEGCKYCNGMCEDSERYVPAEQLSVAEMEYIKKGARSIWEIIEMKGAYGDGK